MGNARISKARKRELEVPDEFISTFQRGVNLISDNARQVMTALVLVLVMIAAGFGFWLAAAYQEKNAGLMLGQIRMQVDGDQPGKTAEKVEYHQVIDRYPKTRAAQFARIFEGNRHYAAGDFDTALNFFKDAENASAKIPDSMKSLIFNGMAYAYEGMNDLDKAARYFEMQAGISAAAVKYEALYHAARLYEAQEQAEKGSELYRRILAEAAPGELYLDIVKEKLKKQ